MQRLRQAEAITSSNTQADAEVADAGLDAMRVALAATEMVAAMQPNSMDEDADSGPRPLPSGRASALVQVGGRGGVFGSAAMVASPGAGANDWPKVGESVPARVSSYGRPPSVKIRPRGSSDV